MTAVSDRPQLLPEEFEEVARVVARAAEGVRLELLDGKLRAKPAPDGDHGRIIQWLMRICLQSRPELRLHDQGLKVQGHRAGRARPDGALAAADAFAGSCWTPSR
ncbi:Uma2 family endonuclease [Kitasatospora sp. NPDC004289]